MPPSTMSLPADLANQPIPSNATIVHTPPLGENGPQPPTIGESGAARRGAEPGSGANGPPWPLAEGTTQSTGTESHPSDLHRSNSIGTQVRRRARDSIPHTVRIFFTAEGRQLRHVTGILFRLGFNLTQVVIVIVILALSGSEFRSRSDPKISEFDTCNKLGIWDALWAARAAFGSFVVVWELKRYTDKRRRAELRRSTDLELADIGPVDDSDRTLQWGTEVRGAAEDTPLPPSPSTTVPPSVSSPQTQDLGSSTPPRTPASPPENPIPSIPPPRQSPRREPRQPPTPEDAMFDRMDTFLTATGLIHFIVNHIWLYTTVHTCRLDAPHVWYLGFSIAALGYLIVLELLLIAFIVFVLGPILLLILNLIMLCLGRPVDRHGNVIVRAEIPRMDQGLIDKIPLVVYIPPSEPAPQASEDPDAATEPRAPPSKSLGKQNGEAGPQEAKSAGKPPATSSSRPSRRRFAWFSPRGKGKGPASTMWSDTQLVSEGDPRFEKCEHPFVVLDTNRATCPICLVEFVEPKRREGVPPAPPRPKTPEPVAATAEGPSSTPQIKEGGDVEQEASEDDAASSKAKEPAQEDAEVTQEPEEDLGTPGEPLRLLACGHVFHKHCLDPWLSKTSGRCPVCNRKVDIPENMK